MILTGCLRKPVISSSCFLMDTVITTTLYDADEDELSETEKLLIQCESDLLEEVPEDAKDVLDSIIASTDGAFDYRIGKLIKLWGIGTEHARVPSRQEIEELLGDRSTFDPGSYGKGYACDRLMEYMQSHDIEGACVAVGGSVLCYGKHDGKDYYTIGIRDPRGDSNDYIGTIKVKNAVVSTSGNYERVLEQDGRKYHHILNPSDGYPAESGLTSVTVISESGLLSDALGTAAFIIGYEKGAELLAEYNCEGIFIDKDMNVYTTGGIVFEETH